MNKVVEKAKNMAKEYGIEKYIPELEIGEVVEINDLWDGEGEVPEEEYTYTVMDNVYGYIGVNYEFDIVEQKENDLDTLIKITNIEII